MLIASILTAINFSPRSEADSEERSDPRRSSCFRTSRCSGYINVIFQPHRSKHLCQPPAFDRHPLQSCFPPNPFRFCYFCLMCLSDEAATMIVVFVFFMQHKETVEVRKDNASNKDWCVQPGKEKKNYIQWRFLHTELKCCCFLFI